MKLLPDTIAGRTTVIMLVSLTLLHIVSICAYRFGLNSEVDLTNEVRLAERLSAIKRALARLPPQEREATAHSLGGGPLEVHWSNVPLTVDRSSAQSKAAGLRSRLLDVVPEVGTDGLLVGAPGPLNEQQEDPHLLLVSMKLADGSWVNFSITTLTGPQASLLGIVMSTSLMALAVLGLALLTLRTVTRPLQQCAATAKRLYIDAEPQAIEVSGPREVRELAVAFNELQQRVKRLVDDRTLTLAAISHDLKTPITRAQLRVEDVDDAELRRNLGADLAEMLLMIDATLAFLKGDQASEAVRDVDLKAILDSICDDMSDLGHQISFSPDGKFVHRGRHLALKRAFGNLIGNAVKYGRTVQVAAARRGAGIEVTIEDDGPGIPADQREAVFAPFYRIEASRNRATGGTGLGLTVARTIVRGHGGDVTLHDSPLGGLRALVWLPATDKNGETKQHKDIGATSV